MHLGLIVLYQHGGERAEPVLHEALTLFQHMGGTYGIASTLLALAWAPRDRGDGATAVARYSSSLPMWIELGTMEGLADTLAGVAEMAGTSCQPRRSTRLLAAAEALATALGYVMPPPEQERYDRTKAALRATLGETDFAAEWIAGQALTCDEAAALAAAALGDLETRYPVAPVTVSTSRGGLTSRERDVLRLVVAGRSNPEIADALFLSRRTVTTHLTNIFAKLGVTGRAEAAALAVRENLV
jgi:DNA-binding CsgD family transcriptional regulator